MTFIILFLIFGLNNLLISQQVCFNLDFANKSWYKKDTIISVRGDFDKYKLTINNKYSHKINIIGKIIDCQVYDILGNKVIHNLNINEQNYLIDIPDSYLKLLLITFSFSDKNGIRYYTIKQLI